MFPRKKEGNISRVENDRQNFMKGFYKINNHYNNVFQLVLNNKGYSCLNVF